MNTNVTKAFGKKASQLSLTLFLPIALAACATSERDNDALEAEQEREGRQLDERQQDERQQEDQQQVERQQEQRDLQQRQLEERNELQGELGERNNLQQGQMGDRNNLQQGQMGDRNNLQQGQLENGQLGERRSSTAGEYIDDTVITANVKAALASDELVKAYQVKVKTVKGVVQLSGFVSSDEVQSRADVVASAIDGVVRVENDLLVK